MANAIMPQKPQKNKPAPGESPASTRAITQPINESRPAPTPVTTSTQRPTLQSTKLTRSTITRLSTFPSPTISDPSTSSQEGDLQDGVQPPQTTELNGADAGMNLSLNLATSSQDLGQGVAAGAHGGDIGKEQTGKGDGVLATGSVSNSLLTIAQGDGSSGSLDVFQTTGVNGTGRAGGHDAQNAQNPFSTDDISGKPNQVSGGQPWIAGTVVGIIAALVLIALFGFCIKRRRNRRADRTTNRNSGVIAVYGPAVSSNEWTKFDTEAPLAEKPEYSDLSHEDMVTKSEVKNAENIEDASRDITAPRASIISDQSNHVLYSHFQDVMPPPSMRSKR